VPAPERSTVVALAGRRIDAPASDPPRFPLGRVESVRAAIRDRFIACGVTELVCSAACGADLLALDVARELGAARHVVLPFDPQHFRQTSVTDRPGDWSRYFDEEVAHARALGRLTVLTADQSGHAAYAAANAAILDEAQRLASLYSLPVLVLLVWDGASRGEGDLTEAFGALARARSLRVEEVLTKAND
jgi:hypothetical protein